MAKFESGDPIAEAITSVVRSLTKDAFAFSITTPGFGRWDVYRFTHRGLPGSIAVKMDAGAVEVGMFESGSPAEQECADLITAVQSAPSPAAN
jgi:hypothetical protein